MNDTAPAPEAAPAQAAPGVTPEGADVSTDVSTDAPAPEPSLRDVANGVEDAPEGYKVPEEFADRKWAENIKSEEDLLNQFDNLQKLVGKKGVPENDAPDEAWDEYFSQLRPETPDAYELALPEALEGVEINEEEQAKYKELLHKAGISPKQAQILFEGDIDIKMGAQPDPAALDAEFDQMMGDKYGSKEASNEAIKIAHKHLASQGEDVRKAFADLPNDQMVAVVNVINDMEAKFAGEGGAPEGGDVVQTGTKEDKVAEANKLRTSDIARDPLHPEHAKVREQLKKLDDEIQRLYK